MDIGAIHQSYSDFPRLNPLTQVAITQSSIAIVFPKWTLLRAKADTINNYCRTTGKWGLSLAKHDRWSSIYYRTITIMLTIASSHGMLTACQALYQALYIISFQIHSKCMRPILLSFTLYRWENWGRVALWHLPKVTGSTAFKTRNHNEVCLVPECAFLTPAY